MISDLRDAFAGNVAESERFRRSAFARESFRFSSNCQSSPRARAQTFFDRRFVVAEKNAAFFDESENFAPVRRRPDKRFSAVFINRFEPDFAAVSFVDEIRRVCFR